MIVSLVTDASYCERTRTGSWAAWAESDRGRFFGGNVLPGSTSGNNSAEMSAAARGLRIAVDRGILAAGDTLRFQTDSVFVAGRLKPDRLSRRARWRQRHGIPQPGLEDGITVSSSPRMFFIRTVNLLGLSLSIKRSGGGDRLRAVDRFARMCMIEERALRDGSTIEAAHIKAFEDDMDEARMLWIRQQQQEKATCPEESKRL